MILTLSETYFIPIKDKFIEFYSIMDILYLNSFNPS